MMRTSFDWKQPDSCLRQRHLNAHRSVCAVLRTHVERCIYDEAVQSICRYRYCEHQESIIPWANERSLNLNFGFHRRDSDVVFVSSKSSTPGLLMFLVCLFVLDDASLLLVLTEIHSLSTGALIVFMFVLWVELTVSYRKSIIGHTTAARHN